MKKKNLMRTVVLALALVVQGCISKGEYRDFIRAAKEYRDALGPDYLDRLDRDPGVPEQVRKNRRKLDQDFMASVAAATSRVDGLGSDDEEEAPTGQ